MRLFFYLLAVCLAMAPARAGLARAEGRYLIDSWQTDEGLPQNSVISMVQSREGYLWLATFNGLVRFDGVRFTIFNSHNTPALDSSRIVKVFEDASGILWVGTESGGKHAEATEKCKADSRPEVMSRTDTLPCEFFAQYMLYFIH